MPQPVIIIQVAAEAPTNTPPHRPKPLTDAAVDVACVYTLHPHPLQQLNCTQMNAFSGGRMHYTVTKRMSPTFILLSCAIGSDMGAKRGEEAGAEGAEEEEVDP